MESSSCTRTKSLLQRSRERDHGDLTSSTNDYVHHGSHDPSTILTTRSSGNMEDNLKFGVTQRALSAHRFLKRTSFYQISRTLSGSKVD
ncbi:hypothetical protein GCK32_011479 [Trichostrongylus colubriformis]|uniref:Uncharacterized protein n=1 Tax=Trichostrongylus colubriformis TaxID=6319 RepID=A0AAN8J0N9_TRICO